MKQKPKGTWLLATVAETKVYLHWSFLLLIVYVFASELIRGSSFVSAVLLGLLVLAVFTTVILHELGHVLTAKRYGCATKDIILLPIGGLARMERLPEKPLQEILVALAGPAVNFLIAFSVYLIAKPAISFDDEVSINVLTPKNWTAHFMRVNLALAIFNLLPAFPMDGGRVLRGLLSIRMDRGKATLIAARIGQSVSVIMFGFGLLYSPFLAFIGVFIFIGAQSEISSSAYQRLMHGAHASDVTMKGVKTIEAGSVLRDSLSLLLDSDSTRFLVVKDSVPIGHLDRSRILESLERHGRDIFIESIMSREFFIADPSEPLEVTYNRLQNNPDTLILIRSGDGIVGCVDLENVLEFILVRQAEERSSSSVHGNTIRPFIQH